MIVPFPSPADSVLPQFLLPGTFHLSTLPFFTFLIPHRQQFELGLGWRRAHSHDFVEHRTSSILMAFDLYCDRSS